MTACHYHNLPWCRLSGCIISRSVSWPMALPGTYRQVWRSTVTMRHSTPVQIVAQFGEVLRVVCSCLSPVKFHFFLFGDSWGVRMSGTHLSACLSVRPHLSLSAKAFRGCPHKSVRQMGGRLFTCHLRDAQATQSAAHNAVCLNLAKPEWWIDVTPYMAQILQRIPLYHACLCLPSAGCL